MRGWALRASAVPAALTDLPPDRPGYSLEAGAADGPCAHSKRPRLAARQSRTHSNTPLRTDYPKQHLTAQPCRTAEPAPLVQGLPEAPAWPVRSVQQAAVSAVSLAVQPDPPQVLPGRMQVPQVRSAPVRQVRPVPVPEQTGQERPVPCRLVPCRLVSGHLVSCLSLPCPWMQRVHRHCRPHQQLLLPHHRRHQEWPPQCQRQPRHQQSLPPCRRLCRRNHPLIRRKSPEWQAVSVRQALRVHSAS